MNRKSYRFNYKLLTAPAEEPVSLADMKLFIKDVPTQDEPLLTKLIVSSRQLVEEYLNRLLIAQTWLATNDFSPPEVFGLKGGFIQSVDNIKVFAQDGSDETVDSTKYFVDQQGARIAIQTGSFWPIPRQVLNGFQVQYVAGLAADASEVPEIIVTAIKQLVVHQYEYREPVLVGTITKVLEMNLVEELNLFRINNI